MMISHEDLAELKLHIDILSFVNTLSKGLNPVKKGLEKVKDGFSTT